MLHLVPLMISIASVDYGIGFELYGKKLGIAGYGAIGREVSVRAMAFGMEILAYDRYMP